MSWSEEYRNIDFQANGRMESFALKSKEPPTVNPQGRITASDKG